MVIERSAKSRSDELERLSEAERTARQKEHSEAESANMRYQRTKISRKHFKSIKLIGRGAFGEVWKP